MSRAPVIQGATRARKTENHVRSRLRARAPGGRPDLSYTTDTLPPSSATGRTVTPAYEGWYENADGTYSLSFGYYNRNTGEVLEIPLGPDNMIEPAGLAQNQPTRFDEGRHWGTFAVRVPGDYGDQEVTWTLKMKGQTLTYLEQDEFERQVAAREARPAADDDQDDDR